MAITLTLIDGYQSADTTQNEIFYDYTATLSGNYGTASTVGDTLAFTNIVSTKLPTKVEVWEAPPSGTAATGDIFVYSHGTTQKNGLLQILTAAATPLTAGDAYPATLTAVPLRVRAWFPSLV